MRQGVIAAISTPPGKGGVAIIRMSGKGAFEIAKEVFFPISGREIDSYPARTQIYGYIIYNEERIDDGMLTCFPSPASYTGEDTVEISCHGGILVTRTVLEVLFAKGAIPADAGEFTRRAFINGKLSLTEAEAIGNLLEAKSQEQIRLAAGTARAKLKGEIDEIRNSLTELLGSIYARIDYPEEDLGEFTDEETLAALIKIKERLGSLIDTYRTGRAINEGIKTVICGKPNVGKSSLYNALVGEDAAIVTDIAGTTRDLLERTAHLGRVMLRLTDTAGLRASRDVGEVEKIGIKRSIEQINDAELILAVFDLSRPFDSDDADTIELLRNESATKICILNKSDKESAKAEIFDTGRLDGLFYRTVTGSCANGEGELIKELTGAVNRAFTDERITAKTDAIVSSARQHGALLAAKGFIDTAIEAYRLGFSADAASSDIEMALGAIGELDGRSVSENIVGEIFSKFCVGK